MWNMYSPDGMKEVLCRTLFQLQNQIDIEGITKQSTASMFILREMGRAVNRREEEWKRALEIRVSEW